MSNISPSALIYESLDAMGVIYQVHHHPPVYSMDDCHRLVEPQLNAIMPKNLFLTPRNQSAHYLCVVRPDIRFRTADISKQIGSSRLSFAPDAHLMQFLCTTPGAISPMGLIFESSRPVRLLADRALLGADRLAFHPNDNAASLAMSGYDFFERFLPAVGHVPVYIDIAPEDEGENA